MTITVMSRKDAISYCHRPHNTRSAIISISDPFREYNSAPFCSPKNGVCGILRLSFCDADRPGFDVYARRVSEADLMSDEDAARVARFVNLHADHDLIVHCDAGISRSAGVAAAILKFIFDDDSDVFDSPRFCPNMWCYRKTLTAFAKQG